MWWERASCADDPYPEAWFPGPSDFDTAQRALLVCSGCPVRNECLAEALRLEGPGIRGGMSAHQRESIDA